MANIKGSIKIVSRTRTRALGYPEDVKRAWLRVGQYRDAILMASGIPCIILGNVEVIQIASLREREYQRGIVKISRCSVGVSGRINSRW